MLDLIPSILSIKSNFLLLRKKGKENTIARDYVLPDYTHIKRGYVRPPEETTGKAKDGEQVCMIRVPSMLKYLQYEIITFSCMHVHLEN